MKEAILGPRSHWQKKSVLQSSHGRTGFFFWEESRPWRGLGRAPMPGRRVGAAGAKPSPGPLLYVLYVLYLTRQATEHPLSPGSLLYVLYVLYLTRQATEHPLSPGSLLYVLYVLYLTRQATEVGSLLYVLYVLYGPI